MCLFEITHKKDRLEPLSSVLNLRTEVGNHAPNCLDSLSRVLKLSTVDGKRTVAHDVICYSLRGVMEIPRYSPHPKTNALIDCIYHSQAPYCPAPTPYHIPASVLHRYTFATYFDTL